MAANIRHSDKYLVCFLPPTGVCMSYIVCFTFRILFSKSWHFKSHSISLPNDWMNSSSIVFSLLCDLSLSYFHIRSYLKLLNPFNCPDFRSFPSDVTGHRGVRQKHMCLLAAAFYHLEVRPVREPTIQEVCKE